ncbi:Pyrophosphate-energized membrane proton pump 2, partial [Sarracenia purpurea var. burkii]
NGVERTHKDSKYMLFLDDDDVRMHPGFIGALTAEMEKNPEAWLCKLGRPIAKMGMLSTAAYVFTMDMFGSIADNAGGIVEIESIASALASFLLFSAYMDEVATFVRVPFKQIDIAIPEVFVDGLLVSMLIFLFSAWACSAVGRTTQNLLIMVL